MGCKRRRGERILPKMKSFLNLQQHGRERGENFSSFSLLRDLCASARELGGLKMLPKKQIFSGRIKHIS
jgi:hypothetical protein